MINGVFWVWLTLKKSVSPRKISILLDFFDTAEDIYTSRDYSSVPGIDDELLNELMDKDLIKAEKICMTAQASGMKILTYDSSYYPNALKELVDPPYVLYLKGRIPNWDKSLWIGVVGTRKCTEYGKRATRHICSELGKREVIIISGMARGIDSIASESALNENGFTIAVLGGGADVIYPPENIELYNRIVEKGLIISEYPPGTQPISVHFPERNRIIAGLSRAVLVTQAPEKSGALITAARALDSGRDVFAVPGDIFEAECRGTNILIQQGAKPVTCAEDIICEYPYDRQFVKKYISYKNKNAAKRKDAKKSLKQKSNKKVSDKKADDIFTKEENIKINRNDIQYENDDERLIIEALGSETKHADELIRETGLQAVNLHTSMIMLEMRGIVKSMPGNYFKMNI